MNRPENPLQNSPELRAETARHHALLEAQSLAGVGLFVVQDGKVTFANEAFERMLGYTQREICALPSFLELIHPSDRERVLRNHQRRLAGESFANRYDVSLLDRSGEQREAEIAVAPLLRDSQPGVLVVAVDITERKRLADALKRSEERFRGLVEATSDWLWEVDAAGRYTYASPRIRDLLGYEPEEVLGRTPFDFMPPEEAQRVGALFGPLAAAGRPIVMLENVNLHRDGRRVVLETSGMPILGPGGELLGYRGVDRDITERKAVERKLRELNDQLEARVEERTAALTSALRELESFSYSASHDLRTPLRGIEGFAALLEMDFGDALGEEGREYVARIRHSAQRLAQLIDEMLDLSRLSRREMKRERVDLSAVARSVVEELRARDPARSVEVEIADGLFAEGDLPLLRAVLTNLIGNAWKFTGRRTEAHIEFGRSGGFSGQAYFVRDNGVGFDMSHAGKLFEPFQRLHGLEEFEGTGIGLASVARIVQRHGGRVWATAAPDAGACFYFTLGTPGTVQGDSHPVGPAGARTHRR